MKTFMNPLCDRTVDRHMDIKFINQGTYILAKGIQKDRDYRAVVDIIISSKRIIVLREGHRRNIYDKVQCINERFK